MKNLAPQLPCLHFRCSAVHVAHGGPLKSVDTEYLPHCRKFYWIVLFWNIIVSYPHFQVISHLSQIKFQNPLLWHVRTCPPVHSPFHCLLSLKLMLPSYQAPAPVPILFLMLFPPLGRAAFLCPFKTPVYISNSIQAPFSRWSFSLISRQSLDFPLYNFPWQLILLWNSSFFFLNLLIQCGKLNNASHPKTFTSLSPKLMNIITLRGKRNFAFDWIVALEMGRLLWLSREALWYNHKDLYKKDAGVL